jgi:hypothetical protein
MNGLIVQAHSVLRPLMVLGLKERRLFSFCLQYYDSRENAQNPLFFDVPIAKFREAYPEYKDYNPKLIFNICEDAVNGIQSKGYRPDPAKKKTVWWFQELEIIDDGMDGLIRFGLTPAAMPFFLNLKAHYISYHMSDVKLMNKPTAWNLYEYVKEKFQNGQTPEWTVTVDELKDRLGVLDKYPRFADFDNRCLDRPHKDINDITDLHVDYFKIKRGKTPVKVKFVVFKKCSDPSVIETEDLAKTFERELENAGVYPKIAASFVKAAIEQSNVAEMLQKIGAAKKSHTKNGKGTWPAYLTGIMQKELLQLKLFEAPTAAKTKAITHEECFKGRGPTCPYLVEILDKDLRAGLCPDCRSKHNNN